ncbi:MAG: sigma 54-interacting transcriptional regulator [Planctomycetes bacterium]|nr:sigma 54-interacting transcriptional regulator [Planctomycetota bacterium]
MTTPIYRLRLLIHGASTLRWVDLDRPSLVLGRGADCDIVVSDPSVSRRHVVLEHDLETETVRFRHLSATNPTLLDGIAQPDGVFGTGHTLTVGMTLVELRRVPSGALVELVENGSRSTVSIRRSDLGAPRSQTPVQTGEQREELLGSLLRIGLHEGDPLSIGKRALAELLALTGRRAGFIARRLDGTLHLLATSDDPTHRLPIPSEVVAGIDDSPEPRVLDPEDPDAERIVVPLRGATVGLLVIGHRGPTASSASDASALASTFGALLWRAIEDSEVRARRDSELERLLFVRSEACRSILASGRLANLRRRLVEAAGSRELVRLAGEPGTEKEELARFLHSEAKDVGGPFVTCYVRLLPLARVRELLFGIAEGSVVHDSAGTCLSRVGGGTLFLDQPEHLPADLQATLAMRIAAARASGHAPRIVIGHAAAGFEEIDARLHPALQREISGIDLCVPPLRGHREDIERLALAVLEELGPPAAGGALTLGPGVQLALAAHSWPENVAELRRVVQTAAVRAVGGVVRFADLPPEFRERDSDFAWVPRLDQVEERHVLAVLEVSNNVKRLAAKLLGISPTTLYEKLKSYGVPRGERVEPDAVPDVESDQESDDA